MAPTNPSTGSSATNTCRCSGSGIAPRPRSASKPGGGIATRSNFLKQSFSLEVWTTHGLGGSLSWDGRRFSSRPELHGEHSGNRAVLEPSGGQITKQPHDTLELLRIPTIVETIARSGPSRRTLLADNLCGDAGGLTDLARCEIAPDTGQHDRLSISVLRGLHLAVRGLRHDPVRDSALRAEAANLLEVHVVQFLESRARALAVSCDRKFDIQIPFNVSARRQRVASSTIAELPSLYRAARDSLPRITSVRSMPLWNSADDNAGRPDADRPTLSIGPRMGSL